MQTYSNISKMVLAVAVAVVVIGGGVYLWQTQNASTGGVAQQNTKTYGSSEFDYSFAYPVDWYFTQVSHNGERQPEVVWISKKDITNEEQKTEWNVSVNRSSLESNMRDDLISRDEIAFAGQSATKILFMDDFGFRRISILVPQNEYTFVISYDPDDQSIDEINAILESFAFTGDAVTYDVSSPQDIIYYTNVTYGFTITLPLTWKGYIAGSELQNWGTIGTGDSIHLGFSAQDSLFNVSVFSKSQWTELQSEEGPIPMYLGENSKYVFGYSTAQDVVNNDMAARMAEVRDIVKTFVVLEEVSK